MHKSTVRLRWTLAFLGLLLAFALKTFVSGPFATTDTPFPPADAPAAQKPNVPVPLPSSPLPGETPDELPRISPHDPPAPPEPEMLGAVAVMISNSPQAVPQVGINLADTVYELEAEFGVTRFLALYYHKAAARIGPIRSARMGFYDIAAAYRLPYAHAGGDIYVLDELKERDTYLLNVDEIYTCGNCFWRTNDRDPPHNLYTSTDLLLARVSDTGSSLRPLAQWPQGELGSGGHPATQVSYHWGPYSLPISWDWNGSQYERYQEGRLHQMDDGATIRTDNLAVLFTTFVWDSNAPPEGLNRITIVGSGPGYLYRDGRGYPIRWEKNSRADHYRFTLEDGSPALLTEGQSWITILKAESHLTAGAQP